MTAIRFFDDKICFGSHARKIVQTDECMVVQLYDKTGEGTMTIHRIFDGAYLIYNDMHLKEYMCDFQLKGNTPVLCVDHCREGRMEAEIKEGAFVCLQEHEMRVDNRLHHDGSVFFPLCHFHGLSIHFDLNTAVPVLRELYGGFSVDLRELLEKYCNDSKPYVLHNEAGLERIMSELYFVPRQIKAEYYKIKALELLLYLDALQVSASKEDRPYFYKSQVEKIKAIHAFITEDLQAHYTMEEISDRFQISLTGMKNCFKEIYGDSMYSYIRRYRMNVAATMLRQDREKSIAEIGWIVGYESPGKFSAAFRDVMGQTPMKYRKAVF